jgi:hypothetical protein
VIIPLEQLQTKLDGTDPDLLFKKASVLGLQAL